MRVGKDGIFEEYLFPVESSDAPVHLFRLSWERFPLPYHLRKTDRPNFVVLFVVRGTGIYRGEQGTVELRPNMLFTYAPGHVHEVMCRDTDPLEVRRIVFIGDGAREAMSTYIGLPCGAWALGNAAEVNGIISQLFRLAKRAGPYDHSSCRRYLYILLEAIHYGLITTYSTNTVSHESFVSAKHRIEQHCLEQVTIQSVAAQLGFSYEYLDVLFRKYTHTTPRRYLEQLRMAHSVRLLREQNLKIGAVARECGYRDIATFSRAFKRFFGVSPGQYQVD